MATLEAIQARMRKLQAQADAMIARRAQAALDQIREIMIKHGLTTEDIEARARKRRDARFGKTRSLGVKGADGKLAPKYRDPKTGATWSGHARPPLWIKDVKDRTRFLIDPADAATAATGAASKMARKAAAKKVVARKTAAKVAKKAASASKTAAKKVGAKKAAAKKIVAKKVTTARKTVAAKKTATKKAVRKVAKKTAAVADTVVDATSTPSA